MGTYIDHSNGRWRSPQNGALIPAFQQTCQLWHWRNVSFWANLWDLSFTKCVFFLCGKALQNASFRMIVPHIAANSSTFVSTCRRPPACPCELSSTSVIHFLHHWLRLRDGSPRLTNIEVLYTTALEMRGAFCWTRCRSGSSTVHSVPAQIE